MILPEEFVRLRGIRNGLAHDLERQLAGDGDNAGGIRARDFPEFHQGAALDAERDASLALDAAIAALERS